MVLLSECHSAQPGLGVCEEHVLKVLVCQHEHLLPLAGAGLHPAQEADTSWHPQSRFSQSVLWRHSRHYLLSAGEWQAPWSCCISVHHLNISSECEDEF